MGSVLFLASWAVMMGPVNYGKAIFTLTLQHSTTKMQILVAMLPVADCSLDKIPEDPDVTWSYCHNELG